MKSLYFQHDMTVDQAYIIRVNGHEISEKLAQRCADSCDEVGQKYQFWDAFNGLESEIKPPKEYSDIVDMVKVTDHYLTRGEVACALSHISLWAHCVLLDKPIVILEHDAIMLLLCCPSTTYLPLFLTSFQSYRVITSIAVQYIPSPFQDNSFDHRP